MPESAFAAALEQPFPGLRAFEAAESFLFFGRQQQTNELLRLLSTRRMLALVGTSGSGKSSLVRAGLLPALYRGFLAGAGSRWRIAVMRPGGAPLDELTKSLIEAEVLDGAESVRWRKAIGASSLGLVETLRGAAGQGESNILLVVDQFEELFRFRSQDPDQGASEAALFVAALLEAVDQLGLPIYVVLTMRSDFLGDCARFEGLPEALNRSQYLVPRLTREQRQEAIEGPLRIAGAGITARLVQRLLNDAGDDPDQLPVLQHALMMTFRRWSEQGRTGEIDLSHYNDVGGMTSAIDRHAQSIYDSLASEDRECAQRVFRCLTTSEGGRHVRRPVARVRLFAICGRGDADQQRIHRIVLAFAAAGNSFLVLSTPGRLEDGTVVDISHECLIRKWGALQDWMKAETDSAEWYRSLVRAARQHAAGTGALWRDPDLAQALRRKTRDGWNHDWAEQYSPGFDDAVKFLDRSRAVQRRNRVAVWTAVILVLVAAVAGYLKYEKQKDLLLQAYADIGIAKANAQQADTRAEQLRQQAAHATDPEQRQAIEKSLSDAIQQRDQYRAQASAALVKLQDNSGDAGSNSVLLQAAKAQFVSPRIVKPAFPPSHAVIIGVAKYRTLPALQYTTSDAQSLYNVLITAAGGNFKPENVHLLTDPTLATVRSEIGEWLPSVAKEGDRVLIFFAGSSFVDQGKAYLTAVDTDLKDPVKTSYPMDELAQVVGQKIKAKEKILFTDACHSGAISPTGSADPSQMFSATQSIFSFSASRAREQSFEAAGLGGGHGVFSYYLVRGLQGEADANKDGAVTADELSEYVREQVRSYTKGQQNPTADRSDFDPNMVLAYVAGPTGK